MMRPTPFGGRSAASSGPRWAGRFTLRVFFEMKKGDGIAILSHNLNRLIRRGGAPSGAAGKSLVGGMGASAPIVVTHKKTVKKQNTLR